MPSLYGVEKNNFPQEKIQENRGEKKSPPPKKKKLNFKICKKNTINSLNEVEHFLNDFQNFWDYIRLYKNFSTIFNRKKKH